jgi:segregation and condensation protein B
MFEYEEQSVLGEEVANQQSQQLNKQQSEEQGGYGEEVTEDFGEEQAALPNENQLMGQLEALLFVTDEPVGTITLAQMVSAEVAAVEAALVQLRALLEQRHAGIQLREVAGGWRLFTNPAYHELVENYVLSWDTRKLSAAAMETLALVAYLQPVTRAGLASVRGVNSDSPLNSLVEKGLVREVGNADTPGNPTLYGTTRGFLEKFGLRSPADLPDIADFAPDEETRRLITERLSATREDVAVSDDQALTMASALMDEEGVDSAEEVVAAMASSLGVVDKIDFDSLTFEFDEE